MKKFLLISTLAMAAAGIYGITDMSTDVLDGTMIVYGHADEQSFQQTEKNLMPIIDKSIPMEPFVKIPIAKEDSAVNSTGNAAPTIAEVEKERKKARKKIVHALDNFSRGKPRIYDRPSPDPLSLEAPVNDSANASTVTSALPKNDSIHKISPEQ